MKDTLKERNEHFSVFNSDFHLPLVCITCSLTQFLPSFPFYTPLKTSQNLWFAGGTKPLVF